MSMQQTQGFCAQCQKVSLFGRSGVNHLTHAIVSLFLCGFWIPIWIICSIFWRQKYRCQSCGSVLGEEAIPSAAPATGYIGEEASSVIQSGQRLWTYRILGLCLGWLGVHNFYIGRWQLGVLQIVVFGIGIAYRNSPAGRGADTAVWGLLAMWILLELAAVRKDGAGRILRT